MKKMKIGQKVIVSYLIFGVIFIATGVYVIISLNKLGELQDQGAKMAVQAETTSKYSTLEPKGSPKTSIAPGMQKHQNVPNKKLISI